MILVDLNQVMISNLMMHIGGKKNIPVEADLVRHMVLNSLRMYRRELYPYYKIHRKKDREQSGLDWNMIFTILNGIRDDIRSEFPYKVIQVPHAEADDVIGTLCHRFGHLGIASGSAEPILILSSDKDFAQLQKYANVDQYSPIGKKYVTCSNPARYVHEHILRGDRGDGVPNFLSADDVFVTGKRQTPLATKKIDAWNGKDPEEFCDDRMLRNYRRNQQLVDLDFIPKNIIEQTNEIYDNYKLNERSKIFNYFVKNKMKNMMEVIHDF